jgi:hypothetical protein
MTAMHRLIYTSTATRLLKEDELFKLLNSARSKNSADHITGILIYHEGCFLQVLEGEKDAVERCFKRICRDGRHTDYIELANEAAISRMFTAWWMAYRKFGDLGPYQQKQFVELRDLAKTAQEIPMVDNLKANAILLAFLSSFRDLELAG